MSTLFSLASGQLIRFRSAALPSFIDVFTPAGALLVSFSGGAPVRHAINYSVSGYPYLYVFGWNAAQLRLRFVTGFNCLGQHAFPSCLQFTGMNDPFHRLPISVRFGYTYFNGALIGSEFQALEQSPNTVFWDAILVGFFSY